MTCPVPGHHTGEGSMRKHRQLLAFVASSAVATIVSARTITPLIQDGDFIPGVGAVTLINNVAVNNSGGWIVEVDTDGPTTADAALIRNGSVLMQEGFMPVGLGVGTMSSFDSVKLNNAGVYAGNVFFGGTGSTTNDSAVMQEIGMVVRESTISTAPQFSAGTPYIGWFETRINNNNQILTLSSVDDPAIASTVDRAIVRWNVSPAGVLLSETVIIKEGDALPGMGQLLVDTATGPHNFDFNDAGSALYAVDGDGATTADSGVYIDSTLLAREGDPSVVVAGRNWGSLIGARVALNNSGGYAIAGTLDSTNTANDSIIYKSGNVKVIQEGDTLPAIGGVFTFTGFGTGPVDIDDNGNVLWFGDWNDADTTRDTGLFLNDQLLVQEGVTQIGGITVLSIPSIQDAFYISDNGQWIIFEATLTGGIDGAFMIQVPEPASLSIAGIAVIRLLRRHRR